jgi:hypothetical protein
MILSESRALSYKLENSKILPLKGWISPNFFSTNKKLRANEKFAVQFHQQLTLQFLSFKDLILRTFCQTLFAICPICVLKKASHPICVKRPIEYVDEIDHRSQTLFPSYKGCKVEKT